MAARPPGFLAAALVLLFAPAALQAVPFLLQDLNTSTPPDRAEIDLGDRGLGPDVSYFAASDPAHGVELWRSDGTPGGTERLTDVCAGRCDSTPSSITVHAGRVFFTADDGFSGDEPWVSDGTPGSERRVRDLCPGPCSSLSGFFGEAGSRLLFFPGLAANPASLDLWQTDGTREGTVRVQTLCAAGCAISSALIPIGGKALFFVNRSGKLELWETDGTTVGTRSLRELGIPLTAISSLFPGDGFAWVWTSDGLWRTDGTAAGTFRLHELAREPDSPNYLNHEALWHGLYFAFLSAGEMIRSDGTPEGTFRIAQFDNPVNGLAVLDSELLFQVEDLSSDHNTLWSSRGTVDTTGLKLELGAGGNASSLTRLSGDRAVFLLQPSEISAETQVWATDGTAAGTRLLAGPDVFHDYGPFFPAGDGHAFFLRGSGQDDLWTTDGTAAGTQRVRSFGAAPGSSGPQEQAALGGKVVFSALTAYYDRAPLFVSDGTAAGTGMLSDGSYGASSFFRFGNRLFFSFSGVWATDGTPGGTAQVSKRTSFFHPALLGGQILFGGFSYWTGRELWKTDGLTRTVTLVRNIDPFVVDTGLHHRCEAESSDPVPGGVVGGRLLLAADDGRSGRELWATDGTPAGTVLVRDINPRRAPWKPSPCEDSLSGPGRPDTGLSSNPQGFVLLGSVALFTADDGTRGRELWITNGTYHGTHRVIDLLPGPRGSAPHDLVRFHNRVYFLAANSGPGDSLWRTDGTARGTTRVSDLTLNGQPSWARSLTVAGDRLFLTVYNETTGAELWSSTGDETGLVADLHPGPGNAAPQSLTALGGLLLFAADDGLTGLEPWRTDGTAAGTVRVGDIAPGRDASSPGPFTASPTFVLTGADDGVHGREPWAIPRAEIVQPPE